MVGGVGVGSLDGGEVARPEIGIVGVDRGVGVGFHQTEQGCGGRADGSEVGEQELLRVFYGGVTAEVLEAQNASHGGSGSGVGERVVRVGVGDP